MTPCSLTGWTGPQRGSSASCGGPRGRGSFKCEPTSKLAAGKFWREQHFKQHRHHGVRHGPRVRSPLLRRPHLLVVVLVVVQVPVQVPVLAPALGREILPTE